MASKEPVTPFVNLKLNETIPYLRENVSTKNALALLQKSYLRYHARYFATNSAMPLLHGAMIVTVVGLINHDVSHWRKAQDPEKKQHH